MLFHLFEWDFWCFSLYSLALVMLQGEEKGEEGTGQDGTGGGKL